MSDTPLLTRLLLVRDPRLPFLDIDLTDPQSGAPLPEICLIGPNGSGKSTLLARLHEAITGRPRWMEAEEGWFLAKYALGDEGELYLAKPFGGGKGHVLRPDIEATETWQSLRTNPPHFDELRDLFPQELILGSTPGFATVGALWGDPERCLVNGSAVDDLPAFLRRCLQEREEAIHRYLLAPENREKTVAEVAREFDAASPHSLPHLRHAWNRLLAPSGFHVSFGQEEGVFFDEKGRPLREDRLGPALRRCLHHVGIAATHRVANLFLDDAEEGLFPALVQDLIPLYRALAPVPSPRLLVATHSPLIAAHFPPEARLRLGHREDGELQITRGLAPSSAGIDELLMQDFGLAWMPSPPQPAPSPQAPPVVETLPEEEAPPAPPSDPLELKRAIRQAEDENELANLIDEVVSLRRPGELPSRNPDRQPQD